MNGKQVGWQELQYTLIPSIIPLVDNPVLGFPLVAGERYETVKPDGTAGPTLTLSNSSWFNPGMMNHFPFSGEGSHYVTRDGFVVHDFSANTYCIVRPYIAPQPTPIERLEKWKDANCNAGAATVRELESIIADLKASVKP